MLVLQLCQRLTKAWPEINRRCLAKWPLFVAWRQRTPFAPKKTEKRKLEGQDYLAGDKVKAGQNQGELTKPQLQPPAVPQDPSCSATCTWPTVKATAIGLLQIPSPLWIIKSRVQICLFYRITNPQAKDTKSILSISARLFKHLLQYEHCKEKGHHHNCGDREAGRLSDIPQNCITKYFSWSGCATVAKNARQTTTKHTLRAFWVSSGKVAWISTANALTWFFVVNLTLFDSFHIHSGPIEPSNAHTHPTDHHTHATELVKLLCFLSVSFRLPRLWHLQPTLLAFLAQEQAPEASPRLHLFSFFSLVALPFASRGIF